MSEVFRKNCFAPLQVVDCYVFRQTNTIYLLLFVCILLSGTFIVKLRFVALASQKLHKRCHSTVFCTTTHDHGQE